MSTYRRLVALRGATSVERNEAEAIVAASEELVRELMAENELGAADLVSAMFTATPDLDAAFPAAGARRAGLGDVPLICATEIAVPGALERCVRVMIHAYSTRGRDDLQHVYLGRAGILRSGRGGPDGAYSNPQGKS